MIEYTLVQSVNLIYGAGACSRIAEVLMDGGYTNAFVVFDKGVRAAGIADKIFNSLDAANIKYSQFDEVIPDPPDDMIEKGAAACQAAKCDCVIGVGGGSSIDSAKAINLMRFNPPPIMKYVDPAIPVKRALGLVTIPTTSGTGSELSNGMIITDSKSGEKITILRPPAPRAEYAIIDPELMVGMPPELTMYTGLDAMAHAIESYTTIRSNLFKDQIAEKALEIVFKWLPVAIKDGKNIEARSYMAIAASLGGIMLGQGGTNISHGLSHVLGARFHIPHGAACAFAQPYVLEYNAIAVPGKIKRIGEIIGGKFNGNETPEEIGAITRDAFIRFRDIEVGMKPVSAFNIDKGKINEMADAIESMFITLNPRASTRDDIIEILEKMLG